MLYSHLVYPVCLFKHLDIWWTFYQVCINCIRFSVCLSSLTHAHTYYHFSAIIMNSLCTFSANSNGWWMSPVRIKLIEERQVLVKSTLSTSVHSNASHHTIQTVQSFLITHYTEALECLFKFCWFVKFYNLLLFI